MGLRGKQPQVDPKRVRKYQILNVFVFAVFLAAVVTMEFGVWRNDRSESLGSLLLRGAATALMAFVLLYFLAIPCSRKAWERRRLGLREMLIVIGCIGLVYVFGWFVMGL